MPAKKKEVIAQPTPAIETVVENTTIPQEVETSVFQKNTPTVKKRVALNPFQLMLLCYTLVTSVDANDEEIAEVLESRPTMKITDRQRAALLEMEVVEDNGDRVTNKGIALILKGCTFGTNFTKMLGELNFGAKMSLFFKLGENLNKEITKTITLKNHKGEDSEINKGMRELITNLAKKVEWSEDDYQQQ